MLSKNYKYLLCLFHVNVADTFVDYDLSAGFVKVKSADKSMIYEVSAAFNVCYTGGFH
jgi:hypothetical protein